jgi:hypothetical protein
MAEFVFSNHCIATPMLDGSGFALYHHISGNSAFLSAESSLDKLSALVESTSFSESDFRSSVSGTEKESSNSLDWLVKNDFVANK